jgi:hypothetical protein
MTNQGASGFTNKLGRIGRWYSMLAILFLNFCIMLGLVNAVLAIWLSARDDYELGPLVQQYGFTTMAKAYPGWSEADLKAFFKEFNISVGDWQYTPFAEFRQRPFHGKYINISADGFRFVKKQRPWPPDPSALNIYFFGGSTTYGYGLPDDQTIPSNVQDLLGEIPCRVPINVYNFAMPDYFSTQERIVFEQLVIGGRIPSVAIFVDGVNEFWQWNGLPQLSDTFMKVVDRSSRRQSIDIGPKVLDFTLNLPIGRAAQIAGTRLAAQAPSSDEAEKAAVSSVVSRWLANRNIIEAISSQHDLAPLFVWQPIPTYKYDLQYDLLAHDNRTYLSKYTSAKDGYIAVDDLRSKGVLASDVLWLADMQSDKKENLYIDRVHYTAAFSREIAQQITEYIRGHGLLKRCSAG